MLDDVKELETEVMASEEKENETIKESDQQEPSSVVENEDDEITSMDDFTDTELEIGEGLKKDKVLQCKVIQIDGDYVFVDVNDKLDGKIALAEFKNTPAIGDVVEAAVKVVNYDVGDLILSIDSAKMLSAKAKIIEAIKNDNPVIEGVVKEKKKEFYIVDIGFPVQVKEKEFQNYIDDVNDVIDHSFKFKITKFINKKNLVFLSRRAYLYDLREKQKKELLETLEIGKTVHGIVRNIKPFGIFVDLGGMDAFIHISDLSWARNPKIEDIVHKGDEIDAVVLKIEEVPQENKEDKKKIRINLSYKQLKPNPWNKVSEKYQEGATVQGKVVKLFEFGVFIELEEGVDGFARKENISWSKYAKSPKKLLKLGEFVRAKIMSVDSFEKKIDLSLKELLPNPWEEVHKKYYVGEKVKGTIVKIIENGAFMKLDEIIDGFISVDNIAWTKKRINVKEYLKVGQEVEAVVLDINAENQRIALGIKQFSSNPWEVFKSHHPKGSVIEGRVASITAFGVFVDLDNDLVGLLHVKDVIREKSENLKENFKKGDTLKLAVSDVDVEKKKIGLSEKMYLKAQENKEISEYMKNNEESNKATFGSFIQLKKE